MQRILATSLALAGLTVAIATPAAAGGTAFFTGTVGTIGTSSAAGVSVDSARAASAQATSPASTGASTPSTGASTSSTDAEQNANETAQNPVVPAQNPEIASATQRVVGGSSAQISLPDLKDSDSSQIVTVMGASWQASTAPTSVEYRTKPAVSADWTQWTQWTESDSGPDEKSREDHSDTVATDPIVVAQGEAVEVRVTGSQQTSASVRTSVTPTTQQDQELAGQVIDRNAPSTDSGSQPSSDLGSTSETASSQPRSAQSSPSSIPTGLALVTASSDQVSDARSAAAWEPYAVSQSVSAQSTTGQQSSATQQTGTAAQATVANMNGIDPGAADSNATAKKKQASKPTQPRAVGSETGPEVGGLSYVSRGQWGAKNATCGVDRGIQVKAMAIHHTEGANGYTKAQVPGILRGIQSYHQGSRGWCDIGYNMLVDRFGTIYEGRSGGMANGVIGAHTSGFNKSTFGVSVVGTYNKPAPATVISTLSNVASWLSSRWGWDPNSKVTMTSEGGTTVKFKRGQKTTQPRILGHRDTSDTDCPGNGLYGQLGQIRANAGKTAKSMTGAIKTFHAKNARWLGAPRAAAQCNLKGGGCYQAFGTGTVYWSAKTGAQFVDAPSAMARAYQAAKFESGALGYPTGGQFGLSKVKGAVAQKFQGGTVVWAPGVGAHAITGAISHAWRASGWERSPLGMPTGVAQCGLKNGGCYQSFQHGTIHWSPSTGAHITLTGSGIRNAWERTGFENGKLGYPTSNERKSGKNTVQKFQNGTITWTSTGAKVSLSRGMSAGTR